MNAGTVGGKTALDLTADGVTTVFASNVLGHVVLLEALLTQDRLGEVAVFAGSEAARGVPKMRMKRPSFVSTSAASSPLSSTAAISPAAKPTSLWPSGKSSTSGPSGWPTWPASTPTAGSSP